MDLIQCTPGERQAALDLAVLAMYIDGHLATVEHDRVNRLLTAMGLHSEAQRAAAFDASVSRVRRRAEPVEAARAYAGELVRVFDDGAKRRAVYALLHDLAGSDERMSPQESVFLAAVREELGL